MLIERLLAENASARDALAKEKADRRSLEAELAAAKAASRGEEEEEEMKALETPKLTYRHRTEEGAAAAAAAAAKRSRASDGSISSGLTTSTSCGRSPYFEK